MGVLRKLVKLLTIAALSTALAFALAFADVPPRSQALDRLDQIITQAKDIHEFLKRKDLQDAYFQALQEYYGADRFPRASYDAILSQLRKVVRRVPGFGQRLWETTDLGPAFTIEGGIYTSGRTLNIEEWEKYRKDWLNRLAARDSNNQVRPTLEQALENASHELDEFRRSLEGLSQKARGKKEAEFYRDFKARHQIAFSLALEKKLSHEKMNDLLGSNDPDLILDSLDELKRMGERTADPFEGVLKVPQNILSYISALVPANKELLQDKTIFPIQTVPGAHGKMVPMPPAQPQQIHFIPIPRRIHGIFKGVDLNECVGGSCANLYSLTPERWATVALSQSWFHHIEVEERYKGNIQLVPGTLSTRTETYVGLDLNAPILRNEIAFKDPKTGEIHRNSLYSIWLTELNRHKLASWAGFVISNSPEPANAGTYPTVQQSKSFFYGEGIVQDQFTHLDPMAPQITSATWRWGHARNYGGNMITNATVQGATEFKVLVPILLTKAQETQLRKLFMNSERLPQVEYIQRIQIFSQVSDFPECFHVEAVTLPTVYLSLQMPSLLKTWIDPSLRQV